MLVVPLVALRGGYVPQPLLGMFVQPGLTYTALSELGPVGPTCLSRGVYEYEPGPARAHWGLLRDLPEVAVREHLRDAVSATGARATDVVVERVAVDLHNTSGATRAQTRIRWSDGTQERYLVQLDSRGSSYVSVDTAAFEIMLCSKDFGDWDVGEPRPST
jgi:hypothetical protein